MVLPKRKTDDKKGKEAKPADKKDAKAVGKDDAAGKSKEVKGEKLSGARELLGIHPSRGFAWLKVGDSKFKAIYHIRRSDNVALVALAGQPSIPLEKWLDGEGELCPDKAKIRSTKEVEDKEPKGPIGNHKPVVSSSKESMKSSSSGDKSGKPA